MSSIGVDCTFAADGRIQVRRIELDGHWQAVEQGRQWADATGRHILIMMPNGPVRELVLRADRLTWELGNGRTPPIHLA
ncbi:MAG: hypothetical protein IPM39_04945 [Chloroflexi bacterium]|nr:hypothetical protein [Chloroflexota bacterium]